MAGSRVLTEKGIILFSCLVLISLTTIQMRPASAQSDEEWSRTFVGENHDMARSLVQTSDGEFVLAGETNSFGAGFWDF